MSRDAAAAPATERLLDEPSGPEARQQLADLRESLKDSIDKATGKAEGGAEQLSLLADELEGVARMGELADLVAQCKV